ncbi:FliM/FliN family flagellar motor switch protein [Paludisphaera rhizosphaerae]|uniref:FliM/FliN family flagellar motor switch protein n=1 Tax=Paludisphaera rhizosphaerae TaxID=2711216 RepID=UPI0013ED7CC5|nr:FliM/FliN family flagellar motor switch protein [Paludisphaera rhizosphaerae]
MSVDSPPPVDVWEGLPRLSRKGLELERRAGAWLESSAVQAAFAWLDHDGLNVTFDRPEVEFRGSGLARPGLVAQLRWPRLRTRLAIGVEVPIVHAVVDRLLGFDRPFEEARLQTTPVEWGVWTYLVVRSVEEIAAAGASPFHLGGRPEEDAFDVSIDRVGPSAFEIEGLGEITTIRWAVNVGGVAGTVRLWLPSSLSSYWIDSEPAPKPRRPITPAVVETASEWRAVAGSSLMSRGLASLRVGGVLPLSGSPLTGTPEAPEGDLWLTTAGVGANYRIAVRIEPATSGRRVRVVGSLEHIPSPPGDVEMSVEPPRAAVPVVDPLDAPVTLTIELGRLTVPLSRLADLKAGEVLELNRHSREPVEISSNGRIVARGDLVLIGDELGVRVTSVFL